MKFRWQLAEAHPLEAKRLAFEARVSPLLAEILIQRKQANPLQVERFLRPKLQHLADPFLLPQMDRAIARLLQARQAGERVVIFGDYDVDGVTSTAILRETFLALGLNTACYLPHRLEEGYGLSRDGVHNCLAKFPSTLLLAVDCGSTSVEVITDLQGKGVDVIVLDHHQLSDPPPPACAVVNPQAAEANGPDFRELCSAGLAFKLAHALTKKCRELEIPDAQTFDLRPLLEWVALGTVADLVPLVGENRILVSNGLPRLTESKRTGIRALKEVAGCKGPIGTYELGFQLGPRLNAAGRLENAEDALELLLTTDTTKAEFLAKALDARNRERQNLEKNITDAVVKRLNHQFNPEEDYVIVEGDQPWHVGVVGIVASRVLQEFYRPTIIMGGDQGAWRGSGRSIEGFDLAQALKQCRDLLDRHGGHAMAAGVSLRSENFLNFKKRLNEVARASLTPEQLQPVLRIDAAVEIHHLTMEVLDELELLKPTGMGNPAVQLCARGLVVQRPPKPMGSDQQHVKFWVNDGFQTAEVVWWNGARHRQPSGKFDLAFVPQVNEYMGRRSLQLKFLDWQPTAGTE